MPRVAQVIYGKQSGIVRRIVVSDSIEELGRGQHCGVEEDSIIVDPDEVTEFDAEKRRTFTSLDEAYALVVEKRGKPSESDRCVVIDDMTGEIAEVVLADPYIAADREQKPGKTLLQHELADIGWSLNEKGEFEAPVVEATAVDEAAFLAATLGDAKAR